jgi:hypothetical protein
VTDTPDLSTYYLIHRALRASGDRLAGAVAGLDEGDRRRARTLQWWFDGFAGELHDHHTIEDEIFFPALAAKVPTYAAYEAGLAEDHAHLDRVMNSLRLAIRGLAGNGTWAWHHRAAVEHSAELARFLHEHLGTEDDEVLPLFERHFTAGEYGEIDEQAIKRISPRQLLFTVPWIVGSGTPEEGRKMLAGTPKVMTLIWMATRRRYARRAALALGAETVEVAR